MITGLEDWPKLKSDKQWQEGRSEKLLARFVLSESFGDAIMKGRKRHNRHRTQKVNNKGLDYELLANNVFLLLKNKDIILAQEDMRTCVLNVKNYTCGNNGDLNYMPLSGNLEWWDKAQEVMQKQHCLLILQNLSSQCVMACPMV